MDAERRRQEIKRIIEKSAQPVSASSLAEQFGVSRQVIVGDVALLRALGEDIIATARGYMSTGSSQDGRFVGKLACRHNQVQTKYELYCMVDMGVQVLDVIVEHHLYGEINGRLNITCRRDVDAFVERLTANEARLLSELTGGVHIHTVSCPSEDVFRQVKEALAENGFLYPEK